MASIEARAPIQQCSSKQAEEQQQILDRALQPLRGDPANK